METQKHLLCSIKNKMPKTVITPEIENYIRENYLIMSSRIMSKHLGCSRSAILRYMKINNLKVPKHIVKKWRVESLRGRTSFTKEEDEFIKNNYLKYPVKSLADKMNRSFTGIEGRLKAMSLKIPKELIKQRKKDSQYKKGNVPMNKGKKQTEYMSKEAIEKTKATRFKKGDIPANAFDEDGIITIRYDHKNRSNRKYKWIRVSLGEWEPLHKHNWEKENGPVPKGHCLWFIDGDSMNCEPENIELIIRAENAKRNTIHNYPAETKQNIQLLNKLKKELSKHD